MNEATFLFLAANPLSPRRVTLDAEMRDIARLLDPASCPVRSILRACWSARPDGVRRALREARPAIVHVSGRAAGATGSVVTDASATSATVDVAALSELLGAFKEQLRIAVFDGHEGDEPALAEELDVVLCISASVEEGQARELAARFYRCLLFGRDVEEAFRRSLEASGSTTGAPPARLLVRAGVTASAVRLASNVVVQDDAIFARAGGGSRDSEEAEVGLRSWLIVRLEGSPADIEGERPARVKEVLRGQAGEETILTETFRDGCIRLVIATTAAGRARLLAAIESRELTALDQLAIVSAETDVLPRALAVRRESELTRIHWWPARHKKEPERQVAHLLVALECQRPRVPGLRLALTDVDEVLIGRGRRRQWSRVNRQLLLAIPDPLMSRLHARLVSGHRGWYLADAGSKNGTYVNGALPSDRPLADGDMIEMAHTFFVYRTADLLRVPGDRDLADEANVPEVFCTLSAGMERHAAALVRAALTSVPVLLAGEPGTGKRVVARAIHTLSCRPGRFVSASCAVLPPDGLVAMVGAAERGTLFLDQVHDLPAESQAALQALLPPVGPGPANSADGALNARVVASTDKDLQARVSRGRFQPDLHALLAAHQISIPPLRERPEDIGSILSLLLARLVDRPDFSIHPQAAQALLTYPYPMNVRELEETLREAIEPAPAGELGLEHLPVAIRRHVYGSVGGPRQDDLN
jgi:hypothetical protein